MLCRHCFDVAEEEEEEDDDDGDDDDEEETDESEDDGNEEPKLKYERLGNSMLSILKQDFASCMCVFERFLALGTRSGKIYVLDFNGNEIRRFSSHKSVVNDICVDTSGEFIASCSDDGKVVLNALYAPEPSVFSYNRVVKCIAMDPNYAHKTTKCFVCGGPSGQLESTIKGWFSSKTNIIHKDEGPIHALQWKGSLMAFATDHRIVIADSRTMSPIAAIPRDAQGPPPSQYRCCLVWESHNVLITAWADHVVIVRLTEREIGGGRVTQWHMETLHQFRTDFWICGIGPFGTDVVVLAYYDIEEDGEVARPELKILSRKNGDELASDILKVIGYERYAATDYRLDSLHQDSLYYVVAPKDVVVARQRDVDDHVSWLLELAKETSEERPSNDDEREAMALKIRRWYEEACDTAIKSESMLRKHTVLSAGEAYLRYLLSAKQYERAAEWCPKILRTDAHSWENWIMHFSYMKQLPALSGYIPMSNPRLGPGQYEMVLGSFLSSGDYEGFQNLIENWPSGLYDTDVIATAVNRQIEEYGDSAPLKLALVKLYTASQQYDKSLHLLLTLRHPSVYEFITEHRLFEAVSDKVLQLITFDERRAVEMLTDHTDRIKIPKVVDQLEKHPYYLHLYLHALFQRDHRIASEYHGRQVELYASYKQDLLLPFLRVSDSYPLEKARAICEEKKLYRELVYVLDRMGSVQEALLLLIVELNDVEEAIRFVLEKKDESLSKQLISFALRSPEMVAKLLMSDLEDPHTLELIRRIPTKMLLDEKDGQPLADPPPADGGELVQEIEHCVYNINQRMSLIVFAEAVPGHVLNDMRDVLERVAKKQVTDSASDSGARLGFFWAGLNGERTRDIRRQISLPEADANVQMVMVDVPNGGRTYKYQNVQTGAKIPENHVVNFIKECQRRRQGDAAPDSGSKLVAGSRHAISAADIMTHLVTDHVLGMEIPQLRDKLVKITRDANNEVSLLEGCQRILHNDVVQLSFKLYRHARQGLFFNDKTSCTMCSQPFVHHDRTLDRAEGSFVHRNDDDLYAFFCGHVYHRRCMPTRSRASWGGRSGQGSWEGEQGIDGDEFASPYDNVYCPVCKAESTTRKPTRDTVGR